MRRAGAAPYDSGSAKLIPRGFTLLEVMVALALLAAALMAVGDLVGSALRNHAYARDLSTATLLARGKLAALQDQYQDQGFRDFDETEEGDFGEEGHPEVRWKVELVKPNADLSADQLLAALAGGGDTQDLLGKLMGGAASGAAQGGGAGGPTTSAASALGPLAGPMMGLLTTQLTQYGELIKKSFRELRLSVAWRDGQLRRGFTVTTHLLVLNPRAPGGARGDNPEVPSSIAPIAGAQRGAQPQPQGGARQTQGTRP